VAPEQRLPCEEVNLPDLARLLQVVADENRLKLLCLLRQNGELFVGELCDYTGLPQNLVSHHLAILLQAGLVKKHRDAENGRRVIYAIENEGLEDLNRRYIRIFGEPVLLPAGTDRLRRVCGPSCQC
jgi:DNA-binding transcriptional ArsR family regulator